MATALMRIVILIILGVLAMDLGLAAWFFGEFTWAMAAVVIVVAHVGLWRTWFRAQPLVQPTVTGWTLGAGQGLDDPERPVTIAQATIPMSTLELGVLTLGAPGSGKTTSLISQLTAFRQHNPEGGYAVFEGKGDLDIYKKVVAAAGAPDHFFSTELPGSGSLNLMAGDVHDVIDRLSRVLIRDSASTSFYADEQRAVLSKVIPLLKGLSVPTTLRDLYVVLAIDEASHALIRRARIDGVADDQINLFRDWVVASKPAARVERIAGLLNRLYILVNGAHTDRLNAYQPSIDIRSVVEGGQRLYCHLPLTDYAVDVAIAITEMFGVQARARQLTEDKTFGIFPLLFDDWGAFFHSNFGPISARCRSARMPLFFSFQSKAQLNAVSPTFADELDDTIATKIVMRVMGQLTCDYAVQLLDTYERTEVAQSHYHDSEGTSITDRERFRVRRADVKAQAPGQAYVSTVFTQGNQTDYHLWQVSIPEPDYAGWPSVAMPTVQDRADGEGLHFWQQFMAPSPPAHDNPLPASDYEEVLA